eukprot:6481210-Amphidinium_carterae.2
MSSRPASFMRITASRPSHGVPSMWTPEDWRSLPQEVRKDIAQRHKSQLDSSTASGSNAVACASQNVLTFKGCAHTCGDCMSISELRDQGGVNSLKGRLGKRASEGTLVVRVTQHDNLLNKSTVREVEKLLSESPWPIMLWISVPCNTGCPWFRTIPNIRNDPRHIQKLEHDKSLAKNALALVRYAHNAGRVACWGWPRFCDHWKAGGIDQCGVAAQLQQLGLKACDFDGCAFGLRVKGEYMKKPWRIMIDTGACMQQKLQPVLRLIHEAAGYREGCRRTAPYAAIQLNMTSPGGMNSHVDQNNIAVSDIIALGKFSGGELKVDGCSVPCYRRWPSDGLSSMATCLMKCRRFKATDGVHPECPRSEDSDVRAQGGERGSSSQSLEGASDQNAALLGDDVEGTKVIPSMCDAGVIDDGEHRERDGLGNLGRSAFITRHGLMNLNFVVLNVEQKHVGPEQGKYGPAVIGGAYASIGEKHSEVDDPNLREYKARIVFQGNCIRLSSDVSASEVFRDVSNTPANMAIARAAMGAGMYAGMEALYGHPVSGRRWEQRLGQCLTDLGWRRFEENPGTWVHQISGGDGKHACLVPYVDDLLLIAPSTFANSFWRGLEKKLEFKEVEAPLYRYLGANHTIGDGMIRVEMSGYAKKAVDRFEKELGKSLHLAQMPYISDASEKQALEVEKTGIHAKTASSHIATLLFLARMSRPDP